MTLTSKKKTKRPLITDTTVLQSRYRSGLEKQIAKQLEEERISFEYESFKIEFEDRRVHRYLPDFRLPNGLIIEAKGWFQPKERAYHLMIRKQHPELDIRFVFNNPNAKLSKTSRTTYGEWCQKHGFKYAKKQIPEEWINEDGRTTPHTPSTQSSSAS